MEDETIIKTEKVSKKFCKSLRRSMYYGLKDIARNTLGRSSHSERLRKGEFWAVDEVSFMARRGETLGVIGPNGSGKTTLLKMLNGIFWPDKGKITIKGRVGALIEVGAGFHPMLTGRENIYINGAILGMSKKEINEKFDDIVNFADIGDFIDTPVKFYSSGMFVRLGFSVAAHCEADILLVDEILAVGDIEFRAKCYNKIAELMENCAVVFVSHNMAAIGRITSECLVLDKGKLIFSGKPAEAVQSYQSIFDEKKFTTQQQTGSGEAKITNLELYDKNNRESDQFHYLDPILISFDVEVSPKYEEFLVSITFVNQLNKLIAQCHSGYNSVTLQNKAKSINILITIPKILLNPAKYLINIIIFDKSNQKYLAWIPEIKRFQVVGEFIGGADVQLSGEWKLS